MTIATEGQLAAQALGVEPRDFPRVVLETLGFTLSTALATGFVARAWTGTRWGEQTLLGAFVRGLGPGGQGPSVVTASAARYVRSLTLPLLESRSVEALLTGSHYKGLVFCLLDADSQPTEITTCPRGAAYVAAMEGAEGKDWTADSALLESWTAGLVLTRWPWPEWASGSEHAAANFEPPASTGRHFIAAPSGAGGILGWATGWDHGLGRACSRASRVAKAITPLAQGVQWRVGAHGDLLHAWHGLVDGPMDVRLN